MVQIFTGIEMMIAIRILVYHSEHTIVIDVFLQGGDGKASSSLLSNNQIPQGLSVISRWAGCNDRVYVRCEHFHARIVIGHCRGKDQRNRADGVIQENIEMGVTIDLPI